MEDQLFIPTSCRARAFLHVLRSLSFRLPITYPDLWSCSHPQLTLPLKTTSSDRQWRLSWPHTCDRFHVSTFIKTWQRKLGCLELLCKLILDNQRFEHVGWLISNGLRWLMWSQFRQGLASSNLNRCERFAGNRCLRIYSHSGIVNEYPHNSRFSRET